MALEADIEASFEAQGRQRAPHLDAFVIGSGER